MTLETPKTEDWFDNVENLRPLRGGRRAQTLNEIASGAIRVSSEEAETKFRQDLELAASHEDPLSVMWDYANWFEEHFPTGKHRIFYPMLYKICLTYSSMERYRNDERMLKLWLKLAESFPESALAVMEFAYTRGSCRELAKFYVRWSEMYTAIGFLHRAREKLELGIAMFATPLPLLHEHMDTVNAQIQAHAGQDDAVGTAASVAIERTLEDCREALGRLRGLGRKHVAPVIRLTQGPPGRVVQPHPPSSTQKRRSMAYGEAAPFEIFVDESPAPAVFAQKMVSSTPLVRRRLVDDLAEDPDYQALFGFFDDREKHDLQFSTSENSSKATCKFPSSASVVKTKRRGLRHLGIRLPPLDFEVFADDDGNGDQIKEEEDEEAADAEAGPSTSSTLRDDAKTAAKSSKKSTAAPKKARLCMRKCLIEEMSVEEGFAVRFR